MFDFLRRDKTKPVRRSIVIQSIGTLYFLTWPEKNFWMGDIDTIAPNKIELSIETYNNSDPTEEQIKLIQQLQSQYTSYLDICYEYLDNAYEEFFLEEIKEMFFLAGIELKRGNNNLVFTLEAHSFVDHLYDHFKYFTIADKEIISVDIG